MNGFFKTPAGIAILIPIIGLAILFAAGIWFMIGIGMGGVLGPLYAYGLASIVAPLIALLSVLTFVWGKEWAKHIEDHEYHYGAHEVKDEDGRLLHYKNKFSRKHFIFLGKLVVLLMDCCGIWYRVLVDPINFWGKVFLLIFGHLLAIAPWIIGEVVYAVANRPVSAIRRDAIRQRELVQIREEARAMTNTKENAIPAHMRNELPAPSEQVFPQLDANASNPSSHANGRQ